MIVWTGEGIVVFIIWMVSFLIIIAAALFIPVFKSLGTWNFSIWNVLSAGLCLWFSASLDKRRGKEQPVTPKPYDTLFFIPVRYWSYIFLAFAAVLAVLSYLKI